ncbi:uncharacterized protein LOC128736119 [Sabethes cyaneus]|uniref:uncharacterized protein LOC128736119 n=1 Tax=Sabethes cyaneus TaxID=53552 RepID=UPI00237E59DE|nr:uncharacterized protein LOC128736119 [Sabethes cyaneus]
MEGPAVENDTPNTPVNNEEMANCVNCNRPDHVDDFVQCDTCDSWWHQSCAGVTPSIADRPWSCRSCAQDIVSVHNTSSKAGSARLALQHQKLKEQHELERKYIDDKYKLMEAELDAAEENASGRTRTSKRADIDKVRKWINENAGQGEGATGPVEDSDAAPSTLLPAPLGQNDVAVAHVRASGSPLKHPAIPSQVRHSLGPKAAVNKMPSTLLQRPIVKQTSNLTTKQTRPLEGHAAGPSKGAVPKVQQDCSTLVKRNVEGRTIPRPPVPKVQGKPNQSLINVNPAQPSDENANLKHLISQFGNLFQPKPRPNYILNSGKRPVPIEPPAFSEYIPTPSQLAARQVMPRDLPQFSGNPADWPVFISSFTNSTLACGYTSTENLCRLQRSLKGAAYDAVQSRLLLPESVPQVMDTLYLLYGRPELLIHALLDKVRSVPAPKVDKLETLIDFGMAVQCLCDHLEAAGQLAHLSNPSLLMELVGKLPAHVKMEWGYFLRDYPEVNLKTFSEFMSNVVISASKVTVYDGKSGRSVLGEKSKPKFRGIVNAHSDTTEEVREKDISCYVCKKSGHRVQECRTFKSLSIDERWRCIQTNKLCRNCLCSHGRRSCKRSSSCGMNGCQYRHHPLLHSVRYSAISHPPHVSSGENHTHRQMGQSLFFRIIPVTLFGPHAVVNAFAFLDDGSSMTLIEEKLVEQLGVNGENRPLCLMWTGNVTRTESSSQQVSLSISPASGQIKHTLDDVRTVKELSLPKQTVSYEELSGKYQHLRGLPIANYTDAVPRLLIGVNNVNLIVPLKVKEGRSCEPVAAKTRLGWCVYGGQGAGNAIQSLNCHSCDCTSDEDMHHTVKDYFALEDVATHTTISLLSEEEKRAQRILEETTVRVGSRFETGLLWKYDQIKFPDSYYMALRRLQCLEKRMERNPKLRENIHLQLVDYEKKGYAHRASEVELASGNADRIWYLPLGAVINPRKPEKVRLIWDAAAKVGNISLNTLLLKGPDQLTVLPAVLARFRQFKVAVSADIKEMFHQILIRKEDRNSQRFLWRKDPSSPPDVYLMDVATFGSTCSPASAQFIKNRNAAEFEKQYPRAVEGIIRNHYVDDSLESYSSVEEAVRVSEEMRSIHGKAGFQLRNWLSNSGEVLSRLGETKPLIDKNVGSDRKAFERVLGMLWLTEEDVLCLATTVQEPIQKLIDEGKQPTKRQILKCLMGFFDPLGLWSAFLVHGKILLQDVWRSGIQWDEKVDEAAFERWSEWASLFRTIAEIRVPRCYFQNATSRHYQNLQLYIFADASEVAYAAAAYFRITNSDGVGKSVLVAAKTKVAPLKPSSIPRLELRAAVLGVRLMQFVEESHNVKVQQRFLWSDSTTVL